jgi:hypothetical protein
MSDAGYYVRMRGRVTGPYELTALRAMVRRGALSRIHELSADGTAWAAAANHAELFAQPAGGVVQIVAAPARLLEHRLPPAPPAGTARKYFYRQEGKTFGPVPLPILQKLAASGKLSEDAEVWPPDDKTPVPARQLAELRFAPEVEAAAPADDEQPPRGRWRAWLLLSLLAALPLLATALAVLFLHYHHAHAR